MKTFEGKLVSQNVKVGIVAARFNEFITSKLLSGAMDGRTANHGTKADHSIILSAFCHFRGTSGISKAPGTHAT